MITLPTHVQKLVYRERAYIMIGYCPDTLAYFNAMYQEALKSFPDLTEEECECGKIRKSSWCFGFTYLTFLIPKVPMVIADEWTYHDRGPDFY